MASHNPILTEIFDRIKTLYKLPKPRIKSFEVTRTDKNKIKQYAEEPSNFDGDNYRQETFKKGPLGGLSIGEHTVYLIGESSASKEEQTIRNELFARVLQMMGSDRKYTVYLFLNPSKRLFPSIGTEVGPKNINGGYCLACQPETIVIYREEDALRVLIHELQHAACCDEKNKPVPELEAETEAWAEVLYAMFLGVHNKLSIDAAWRIQSGWSLSQNFRLRSVFHVNNPSDYAWRYTVGKEVVWRRWNLPLNSSSITLHGSLRLGAPERLFVKAGQPDKLF